MTSLIKTVPPLPFIHTENGDNTEKSLLNKLACQPPEPVLSVVNVNDSNGKSSSGHPALPENVLLACPDTVVHVPLFQLPLIVPSAAITK